MIWPVGICGFFHFWPEVNVFASTFANSSSCFSLELADEVEYVLVIYSAEHLLDVIQGLDLIHRC